MPALLEIKGIRIDFPIGKNVFTAAKNVDFSISEGEILGVVGESGAGKSTLGNAVIRLLPYPGRISSGKISFSGKDLSCLKDEEIRKIRGNEIGIIFQDPMSSLNPLLTVGQQLAETMREHLDISAEKAREKGIDLLAKVGIPHPEERFDQYPHQFSGGMRQRVVIAIALCCDPKLIIADEPTTALDVSVQDQILELLKKLCKERRVGVLLVTHDMGVVANVTDRILVMYRGKVVEQGTTREILTAPRHEYTKALISAVPPAGKKIRRFPLVTYIEPGGTDFPKINLKEHWLGTKDTGEKLGDDPILRLENVTVRFLLKKSFLNKKQDFLNANDNVSLEIKRGESFGLVGESGSGKSTLARVVCGLYKPDAGKVIYRGVDLSEASKKVSAPLRGEIQMIFQNPFSSLNPRKTVYQTISEPMLVHGLLPKRQVGKIVGDLLDHVGLGSRAGGKYPHEFSGGQQQRISIARALSSRPKFLICDEPTSALDVSVQAQILNLLKDLQEELGLTMLFITHDLPVVRQVCDRIAVMRLGKILESGSSDQIFNEPAHEYTRELLSLMPALDKAFETKTA